jgi:flagellar hook-basal body complex protein FliE
MSNLRIDSFKPLAAQLKLPAVGAQDASQNSFGKVLSESLKEVNELQAKSDISIEELVSGKSKNIHETMINISKADLAFRMTLQIRNKAIEAYQEIMRSAI